MDRAGLIYLAKALTPLHPGAGESVTEAADLIIQRDKLGLPIIDGPSLKGGLRSRLKEEVGSEVIRLLFGSEPRARTLDAGSVSVLDALPLLIPVRSLFGGWAYVTSPWLLFRFSNRLEMIGDNVTNASKIVAPLTSDSLKLRSGEAMAPDPLNENIDGKDLVILLDEYIFIRKPTTDSFTQFAEMLSSFVEGLKERLIVLPDELLRPFLSRSMRIQQRVRLTSEKTVEEGPWSEEQIPPETILHFMLLCSESRTSVKKDKIRNLIEQAASATINKDRSVSLKPEGVRKVLKKSLKEGFYLVIGGDETVGRGVVETHEFKGVSVKTEPSREAETSLGRPEDVEFGASISNRARLSDVCEKIKTGRPKGYVKELQGMPTLLAQSGILPTFFYYKQKGEDDKKKEREWWVLRDLNERVCKVLVSGLHKDKMLDPLELMLLEQDITKFASQLKRLSGLSEKR